MAKRAYHHGNLRAALVHAGLRAIATDGPEGFSLRDVARRAGVSPPAVYRHFADKDELLTAIAIDCFERLHAGLEKAVAAADPDPLAQFRATGVAYLRFAVAHPAHFRALCIPHVIARAPLAMRQDYERRAAVETAALGAAQDAGLIAPLPLAEAMLAARAVVHGLAHMIIQGDLGEVDDARAEQLAIAVTGALGVGLFPRVPGDPLAADQR